MIDGEVYAPLTPAEEAGVDRALRVWAEDEPNVDSEPYVALVMARIASADEENLDAIDPVLLRWAGHAPDVDEGAFVRGVMAQVAPARQRSVARIIRIAAPLAAAAALVLTTTLWWPNSAPTPVCEVEIGPEPIDRAMVASARKSVVVAFAREDTVATPTTREKESRVGYVTAGAEPMSALALWPPM